MIPDLDYNIAADRGPRPPLRALPSRQRVVTHLENESLRETGAKL